MSNTPDMATRILGLICFSLWLSQPSAPADVDPLLYGMYSPWRSKIEDFDGIALSQEAVVALRNRNIRAITLNTDAWTPAVVYSDHSTPRMNLSWSRWTLSLVPIGPKVVAAARFFASVGDTDSSVCVVDRNGGLNYSLYGVTVTGEPGSVTIKAGGVVRNNGPGWWDNNTQPWIGRASGAALCGGLVLAEELASRNVAHALAIGWPRKLINARAPVFPARTSDGVCHAPGECVAMGTRLQLNPNLSESQLKAFGLGPADIAIAKAFQKYGAYVVDSSDTLCIYVESALGDGRTTYELSHEWPSTLIEQLLLVAPPPDNHLESRETMGKYFLKTTNDKDPREVNRPSR